MAEIFDPNAASFDAQNANLERQRRVIEFLRANADKLQAPQGQMIGSGPGARYVPPSWADMLVKPAAQLMAGYQQGQQGAQEAALTDAMGRHAQEWRSSLPQATAAVKGMPANYVMESPEGQAGTPDSPGNPLTAERVLRHALAAQGNPLLKGEADAYAKYGMMDVENKQRQDAAAAEKQAQREFLAEQARLAAVERGEQKAADRLAQEQRDRERAQDRKDLLTLKMTTPNVNVRVGGGEGGFGGAAPVIGADEAGNPIYRHKSGKLFQYNDVGAPVLYEGKVGAKPAAAKEPTEAERVSAGYLGRMEAVEKALVDAPELPLAKQLALDKSPTLANYTLSGAQQVTRAQQEDWVRAKLRKESGAVIASDEMAREIRMYFPMPGDGPEVRRAKAQARAQAAEQLRSSAGRAKPVAAPPVGEAPKAPAGITLPPGFKYVGPAP